MIDRLAVRQAIFDSICSTAMDADCLALQNGRLFFDGDCDANALADAAIAAVLEQLQEPSDAMIETGQATLSERGCNPLTGDAAAAFVNMIETAFLQPESSPTSAE